MSITAMSRKAAEQQVVPKLGFKVEDGHVKTEATRKDSFDQEVPEGVRPATEQEIKLWELLISTMMGPRQT